MLQTNPRTTTISFYRSDLVVFLILELDTVLAVFLQSAAVTGYLGFESGEKRGSRA